MNTHIPEPCLRAFAWIPLRESEAEYEPLPSLEELRDQLLLSCHSGLSSPLPTLAPGISLWQATLSPFDRSKEAQGSSSPRHWGAHGGLCRYAYTVEVHSVAYHLTENIRKSKYYYLYLSKYTWEYTQPCTHILTCTHPNKCSHTVLENWMEFDKLGFPRQFPVNWGIPTLGSDTRLVSASEVSLAAESLEAGAHLAATV